MVSITDSESVGLGSNPGAPAKNFVGIWCNGSTSDFDSLSLGSNPGIPAIEFKGLLKDEIISPMK
jgi:hypothetical protein